jgi:hypothetical protein
MGPLHWVDFTLGGLRVPIKPARLLSCLPIKTLGEYRSKPTSTLGEHYLTKDRVPISKPIGSLVHPFSQGVNYFSFSATYPHKRSWDEHWAKQKHKTYIFSRIFQ